MQRLRILYHIVLYLKTLNTETILRFDEKHEFIPNGSKPHKDVEYVIRVLQQ